jgi:hypothetical protein
VVAALVSLVFATLRSDRQDWDAARLAHSAALLLRGHFYEAPHTGPVIGTDYGPVGTAYFVPAALIRDPARAVLAASILAAIAFLAPLSIWLSNARAAAGRRAILGAGFVIGALATWPLSVITTSIHPDAPALALAVLACMIVAGEQSNESRRNWLLCAGVSAAVAVAAKQTMLPVLLALPIWLALRESVRSSAAFVLAVVLTLVTGAAVILSRDGAATVWYHVTLVLAFHVDHSWVAIRNATVTLASVVAAPVAVVVLRWRAGRSAGERPALPRATSLFMWAALAALPATLAGLLKWGGFINSLAPATLLVWYAGLTGLAAWPASRRRERDAIVAGAFAVAMVFAAPRVWSMMANARPLQRTTVGLEAAHERAHPEETWFPMDPLIEELLRGRITHFGAALYERSVVGDSTSEKQWRDYLPANFKRACWAPPYALDEAATAWIANRLGGETTTADDLPGWFCVRAKLR